MNLEQKITVQTKFSQNGEIVEFDEQEILFQAADKTLGDSLESGDLSIVALALMRFRHLNQAAALSTARLLHGVNHNWQEWEHEEGDSFVAWAVRETGHDAQTVRRRVCEWEFLTGDYIPKNVRGKIREYTIRQLDKAYSIRVNCKDNKSGGYLNLIEEDYRVTDNQWLALSEAVDEAMVADVVREIKEKEKNSNHMSLKIDDDGTIWVYQGKASEVVGQLRNRDNKEIVQKAIRRICENSGITYRNEY